MLVCIAAMFALAGCSPLKTLRDDQYFLNSQQVTGTKQLSKSTLKALYKQRTNTKFLGLTTLVSIYNLGYSFHDSNKVRKKIERAEQKYDTKIKKNAGDENKTNRLQMQKDEKLDKLNDKLENGNFLMKTGEPPVVYDSSLINQTLHLLNHALLANGFFNGKATRTSDTSGRRINVTYNIGEGPEFMVDELHYLIEDPRIDSLVMGRIRYTRLKKGERYLQDDLTSERDRLTQQLKNNGYYQFSPAHIYFNVDTTGAEKTKIKLQTVIRNPEGMKGHPVYTIDSVLFISNRNFIDSSRAFDSTYHNGIYYKSNRNFRFSKRIADRKIKIHPGDVYSLRFTEATQRNLSLLDMFRTVAINFEEDTMRHRLSATIQTRTLRKHSLSGEAGVNIIQGLVPGPFGSISYRQRNTFKGFEVLELSLRGAISGQAAVLDPENILKTEEYSVLGSLTFPKFYLPGVRARKLDNQNPRTKIVSSYSLIRRPEYERTNGNLMLVYTADFSRYRKAALSLVDINFINTSSISDTFRTYLDYLSQRGNNLSYAFSRSYVSGVNATYSFNNQDPMIRRKARNIMYYLESGGTLFNLTGTETFMGLNAFRYIRAIADLRHYYPVNEKSFLALRFNIGAGKPYGPNLVLPYEKYFFAGGPNSLRAWKLRRLGPGSYAPADTASGDLSYRIEQPGELLIEASMEYRFAIVGFFEGAFFVDAGNIWMLTPDPARPGSEFKAGSFFNQIAVGSGFGLRLNLSFLIIRLDLGIKVYDPAFGKFVLTSSGLKESVLNFGIGYPF